MGLFSLFRRKLPGLRFKLTEVSTAPKEDVQLSKGSEIVEQEDIQDEFSLQIPGAFPSSPPRSPQAVPSDRVGSHDLPTHDFDRMDLDVPSIPELYTDLGSHLRPKRPLRQAHIPTQARPALPVSPPSHDDSYLESMEIDDPWAERSMLYEKLPFGRPVSAVQLVYPQKKPLPTNRIASIYQKEWEQLEQARLKLEGDQGRPARIRPQGQCVRQLSWDWANRVSKAMGASGAVAQSLSGDALYPKDIATCIKPFAWLNDEIINSYLAVVIRFLQQSTGNAVPPRYHAFNSFFYSSLRDKGYDGVRRWAKRAKIGGEALLQVDTVFVPVHESAHWTLMVVRPADRTIEYFDSLPNRGFAYKVNTIKKWLRGELGAKFVDEEWTVLPSVSSEQDNGSDCGVFLLTNAKAIALNIEPTAFGASDTRLLRQKIVAEIMNGGLHGEFSPIDRNGTVLL